MDLRLLGLTTTCSQEPRSRGSGGRELFTFETLNPCAAEAFALEGWRGRHQHPTCPSQSHRDITATPPAGPKEGPGEGGRSRALRTPLRFHTNHRHRAALPWANLISTSWEKEDTPPHTRLQTQKQRPRDCKRLTHGHPISSLLPL